MKNKCTSCGTINWADAKVCIRCSRSLDAPAELTGFERLEAQSDRKGMPLGVYLMFGFVALFVVFMGIKMVMDNRAETARIEAKKKADAEAEAAYQKLLADTQAADLKRMQEIMAGTSPNQEPRPGAFRGIDKTSVPPPIRSTYERYGEYNIPPAGTVYEHRNGQMHQVR